MNELRGQVSGLRSSLESFGDGVPARLRSAKGEVESLVEGVTTSIGSLRPEVQSTLSQLSQKVGAVDQEISALQLPSLWESFRALAAELLSSRKELETATQRVQGTLDSVPAEAVPRCDAVETGAQAMSQKATSRLEGLNQEVEQRCQAMTADFEARLR